MMTQKCLFLSWFFFGILFFGAYKCIAAEEIEGVCSKEGCSETVELYPPESIQTFTPDKMGFDEIYVINLKRRPEKRTILEETFKKFRLNVTFWDAVDGMEITDKYLEDFGVKMIPGYLDPHHRRPMKYGEIGCSLSHYFIWKDIEAKGHKRALILEDDATFEPMFRRQWNRMFADVQEFIPNWDLIYLGRKILLGDRERPVEGSNFLIWPNYSYWTVAYALSNKGTKKLLDQKPLKHLVPVDEFLPIMFDRNPNGEDLWNKYFFPKNLVAVSINPLLISPAWFPGIDGYLTDTENTEIVKT